MKIEFSLNKNEYASNNKLLKALNDKFKMGEQVPDEEFCIADKGFKAEGKKTENGGCSVEFVIPEWVTTEVNQVIIKHLDAVASAVNAVKSACEFIGYVAKDINKDLREVFEKHLLK